MDDKTYSLPNAAGYQPIVKQEDPAVYEKWHRLVINELSSFIEQNEPAFRAGLDAKFEFPIYRDGGAARQMWAKHYGQIIQELREQGWTVRLKLPIPDSPIIYIASVSK